MTAIMKTERLLLRPLEQADAVAYLAMRHHPEVAKWLPVEAGDPREHVRATIERFAGSWRERGYAPWGIFHDGRLIGHGGLNYLEVFEATEVLWTLHPDFWGCGFAGEMAQAALGFGFETLGLDLIFAITKPDNLPSRAVMERLGLSYRKNVVYKEIDAVWYDLSGEDFLRRAMERGIARSQH
jgi:[ribosomal protein S5]-alanine N-acetyltransferase